MCEIKGESLHPISPSSTRIEIETDEKSSQKSCTCISSDFSSSEKIPELVNSSKELQIEEEITPKKSLLKFNCSKKVPVVLVIMALASVSFVLITIAVLCSNFFNFSESAKEPFFKTDWRESRMLENGGTNPEPVEPNYYDNNYNEQEKDIDREYVSPMYLCRENSTDCLFIMRHNTNTNNKNNDTNHQQDHHESPSSDLFASRNLPEEIELEGREIRETRENPDSFVPDFSEENQKLRLRNGTVLSMKPLEKNLRFRLSPTLLNHDYLSGDSSDESTTASVNYDDSSTSSSSSEKIASNILTKKFLAVDPPTTNTKTKNSENNNTDNKKQKNTTKKKKTTESLKKGETEDIENISNKSRIIAYTIRPSSTNISTTSSSGSLATYPTITLASLARQLIFPNWLWSRAGVAAAATTQPTSTTSTSTSTVTRISNRTGLSYTKGLQPITQLPSISFDNNLSRFLKLFTLVRFENTACSTVTGQNGTCYNSRECSDLGGVAAGKCANGFGVCCVFQVQCNGVTSRNGTYFVDTGVTFQANQVQTCSVTILKRTPLIKQMRVDFISFSLRQPVAGSCEIDRFIVSGQNTNNIIPILCGQNTGSHIYVETTGSSNGIQLSIMTTGEGSRSWVMRITQYATTDNQITPPPNCLQYHRGVMGMIRSFNYLSTTSPQYLNNLNYAICIRREAGFCSVTYSNAGPDGTYQPFQIVNANAEGTLVIPSGQAGVGVRDCPFDYININGIRLCGERLNDATSNIVIVQDAPVTDFNNGPFIVNVRTNEIDVGGGFNIYYRQNPCMSMSG